MGPCPYKYSLSAVFLFPSNGGVIILCLLKSYTCCVSLVGRVIEG